MKRMILLLLTVAAMRPAEAQTRHELTVKEAVELAYKNVIDLQNAQLDLQIQEAKNREILGQAYPQISGNAGLQRFTQLPGFLFPDATSSAVYQILKDEGVNGTTGPITNVPAPQFRTVSFQQPWNGTFGLTLNQLLFQPDVFVGLQARSVALNYSRAQIEGVRERVKDSAYRRYYAILVAEKQSFYLAEGIKRLEKLYRDDSIMYKNGFAERLDLDKVQVQLNNLRSTQALIQSAVNLSYSALKFSLGLPQKDTVVLRENLTNEGLKQGLLENANSFTYTDRPAIRTLEVARQLQSLDMKRNRLSNLPTVALTGNYAKTAQGQKFITSDQTLWITQSFIGLNVAVPIFDGGQRRYRVKQSQLNLQKLDNTIRFAKQGIDFEQVANREQLLTALSTLDLSERNVQLAEVVYNTTKKKFESGLGSSFEVLQADSDWQQAQANYFSNLYNATVARVGYLASLGKLP